jgi:hypothetical protein
VACTTLQADVICFTYHDLVSRVVSDGYRHGRDTVPQDNYPPLVVVVGPPGRLDGMLNIVKSEDSGSGTVGSNHPPGPNVHTTANQSKPSDIAPMRWAAMAQLAWYGRRARDMTTLLRRSLAAVPERCFYWS